MAGGAELRLLILSQRPVEKHESNAYSIRAFKVLKGVGIIMTLLYWEMRLH